MTSIDIPCAISPDNSYLEAEFADAPGRIVLRTFDEGRLASVAMGPDEARKLRDTLNEFLAETNS